MPDSLTLPAPAKLNLFIHITGRRDDGYHLLQTVFQILDYSDEISLTLRDDGNINRKLVNENQQAALNIKEDDDLTVRAAKLLQKTTQTNLGVDITLNKKLPIGGGIGGGSSDAATVLKGLNVLWRCGLSEVQLSELGLQLGADVPVFIQGKSAWAEGVGEQLTPLDLTEKWFLVIHPEVSVSTAEIFADQGLTRDCEPLTITRFLQGCESKFFTNIFEPVVKRKYPQIAQAIDWLSAFSSARLTGTGACVFASFDSSIEAQKVLEELQQQSKPWKGFVAKGVNKSPLHNALQKKV